MTKKTPLWKALLFQHRLPWRYKELGLIRGLIYSFKPFNINTQKYWDKKLNNFEKDRWRDGVYKNIINDYLPKDQNFSLLDIGCALGDGCILMKKHFPDSDINGCDISKVGIKKAKAKNKDINLFECNILKEKLDKKYDFITMVSILEHFDNPFSVIDKCLKYVNKALIIDCPYDEKNPSGEHKHSFDENTLKRYNVKFEIYFADQRRITYIIKKSA